MKTLSFVSASILLIIPLIPSNALAQTVSACMNCHNELNPQIVSDWQLSRHRRAGVNCTVCHGAQHRDATDVANVEQPGPEICEPCHLERTQQFRAGKHALAWAAMNAMPTTHALPVALTEGMKGCGGCHKIGLKTAEEIEGLKADGAGFGVASCDACHTRHLFSAQEARQPQACQTCHMGFDHPQWEMYSASKHGVRYLLKQNGTLPETVAAPTCQTCHMPDGNHEVRTAWGFLAVRLPMPEDEQWAADRGTILQALGVLDPEGNPTARLEVVQAADVARLTQEAFDTEREKMLQACHQCHSMNFARGELEKGDQMIKEADHLLAEAIRVVAVPRRADRHRARALRHALGAPHACVPRDIPCQPRLCTVVRLERDGEEPDQDQGDGGGDEKIGRSEK